ncbi:hypothetical protein GCM10027396_19620 [Insolitispirillum peregrinum]
MGVVQVVKDAPAAFMKGAPFFGQAQAAGRALEEPHAKLAFEFADRLANGGRGQVQHPACRGETAKISRSYKGRQSSKTVHGRFHSGILFRIDRKYGDLITHSILRTLIGTRDAGWLPFAFL